MNIKNINIPKGALLAPIAGYSDVGFRAICAEMGASITYTEMASAKGMYYEHADKTEQLLFTTSSEKIKAAQIFGGEPFFIAKAVENKCLEKFDILDINMGCPVPKVVNNGEGSALMKDPVLVRKVVTAVAGAIKKPLTVKIRKGFDDDHVNAVEIATGCRKTFSLHECQYGYRDSVFKKELCGKYIITSVVYRLSLISKPVLEYGNVAKHLPEGVTVDNITPSQIRDIIINIRKDKLPDVAELGSAGSFFKNPVVPMDVFEKLKCQVPDIPHYLQSDGVKIPAAWLIEQCGWKGKSFGGAKVYEKQPLVIVNQNNAFPNDVIVLAQSVANSVKKSFGINIVPEVIYL